MVKEATPKKTTPKVGGAASNNRKRNLALEQQTMQRTSAREWLLKSQGEEIEVPSGNVALLRRPGPEMFFRGGVVPDALSGIVNSAIREKQGLPPEKAAEMANDPKLLPKMIMMIDSAVVEATVDPKVRPNPSCVSPKRTVDGDEIVELCDEPSGSDVHGDKQDPGFHKFIESDRIDPDDREPPFLYADEVDFTDKVFIFQYAAGGSRDLERFREEHGELVDSVSASTDSPK